MGDNHDKRRSLQRDARALAKEKGIKYTAALRLLTEGESEMGNTDNAGKVGIDLGIQIAPGISIDI